MSNSRQTGLLRLVHLREHTEAVDETMITERVRFARLAKNDATPRVVSAFNLFQTPPDLAVKLVELAGPLSGRILEPSAGLGRIYRAIRTTSSEPVTLIDNSAECCGELYRMLEHDSQAHLVQADFLACDTVKLGRFDHIIMNPPFKMGRDIKHIRHARAMLAPGGRLVAICANGPRQRAKLMPDADEWIELPTGSFKSEGTNVNAAICIMEN